LPNLDNAELTAEVAPEMVRRQLAKVLDSPVFASSPRLQQFLRFAVEETLNGRGSELKEWVIGTRVYNRSTDFNPSSDSIVRVEASRLRAKLRAYYAGQGVADAVVISVPLGGYVPAWTITPQGLAPRQASSRKWQWLAAGALAAVALVGYSLYDGSGGGAGPVRPVIQLDGEERNPAISPDGKQLAFVRLGVAEPGLYISDLGGGAIRRAWPGTDIGRLAWTPDGRGIAFASTNGPQSQIALLDIRTGDAPRIVTINGGHFAWSADGEFLIVSHAQEPGQPSSLFSIRMRDRQWERLTTSTGQDGDRFPAVSPDGKSLAFFRGSSFRSELYVMGLQSPSQPKLAVSDVSFPSGLAWTPGRRSLTYSALNGTVPGLWEAAVDESPGQPPVAVHSSPGAVNPVSWQRGKTGVLVFEHSEYDLNLYQRRLDSENIPATRLSPSTKIDLNPALSPDGERVAFSSTRSGKMAIWVAPVQGGDAVPITSIEATRVGSPRWSPDGQWIAFDALIKGNRDVYIVGSHGGPQRRITESQAEEGRPSWSRDGKFVYFLSDRSGMAQIHRVDVRGGEVAQITRGGGYEAFETRDGASVVYIKDIDGTGLWTVPREGGTEVLVHKRPSSGCWAVAGGSVFYADRDSRDSNTLVRFDPDTGKERTVAVFERPLFCPVPSLTVSEDTKRIVWTQIDRSDSDLFQISYNP